LNPLAVLRKRFAAARLVFNLGMSSTPHCLACSEPQPIAAAFEAGQQGRARRPEF
jgi:hypothetical protein